MDVKETDLERKEGFFKRVKNIFSALIQDNEDEKELAAELEELNNVQANLKAEKDYQSNIKGDFIPKVEVEKVNVKQNQTRKREQIDREIGE